MTMSSTDITFIIIIKTLNANNYHLLRSLLKYYTLNNNTHHSYNAYPLSSTPNYGMDEHYRRRSKRTRKQTKPHWQQPSATEKLNRELEQLKTDNVIDDDHIEKEITDYQINDKHFLKFPFKVSSQLIDSLYDKLYLPEKYNDILSNKNVTHCQKTDSVCSAIRNCILHDKLSAKHYLQTFYPRLLKFVQTDQFYIHDDLLYIKPDRKHNNYRLVVPSKLIHPLLDFEHCINHLGHPGVQALARILNVKYYWPHLHKDVESYVQQCTPCQLGKGSKNHKVGKLSPVRAQEYSEIVHFDFAGAFFKIFYILILLI